MLTYKVSYLVMADSTDTTRKDLLQDTIVERTPEDNLHIDIPDAVAELLNWQLLNPQHFHVIDGSISVEENKRQQDDGLQSDDDYEPITMVNHLPDGYIDYPGDDIVRLGQ